MTSRLRWRLFEHRCTVFLLLFPRYLLALLNSRSFSASVILVDHQLKYELNKFTGWLLYLQLVVVQQLWQRWFFKVIWIGGSFLPTDGRARCSAAIYRTGEWLVDQITTNWWLIDTHIGSSTVFNCTIGLFCVGVFFSPTPCLLSFLCSHCLSWSSSSSLSLLVMISLSLLLAHNSLQIRLRVNMQFSMLSARNSSRWTFPCPLLFGQSP